MRTSQYTSTIGIDVGKNTFHLVGLDKRGAIVLQQKVTRHPLARRAIFRAVRSGWKPDRFSTCSLPWRARRGALGYVLNQLYAANSSASSGFPVSKLEPIDKVDVQIISTILLTILRWLPDAWRPNLLLWNAAARASGYSAVDYGDIYDHRHTRGYLYPG